MALDLESVRMFVKVAELASFTRAGEQLGVPKSRVSLRVGALETELGSRLLQRTTRAVRLTPDGEQFLVRARQLVEEVDDLGAMFVAGSDLRGRVRVDLPIALARSHVIPRLPDLIARHPQLEVLVSTTDRRVDIVREGFDCVLRIGTLTDSRLVAKRLGVLPMVNVAGAGYVRRLGMPRTLADLSRHQIVHYSMTLGGEEPTFEHVRGKQVIDVPMKSVITVNNTDAYHGACLAGLGIAQLPLMGAIEELRTGELVEVLPDHRCAPMPVSLVHTHGKGVPKRVRAVMAFLDGAVRPALE